LRLGLCTSCLRDVSLPEALRWAGEAGFESVEIEAPPLRGATTWYQQSYLNVAGLDGPGRDAFLSTLEKCGLRPAALAWYPNVLESDAANWPAGSSASAAGCWNWPHPPTTARTTAWNDSKRQPRRSKDC
jgi:sugar phosphate isomerase/epimerase